MLHNEGKKICQACRAGDLTEINKALDRHIELLNYRDTKSGMNALDYACDYNHVRAVKLLLERGSNIDARDRHGKTVFQRMIEKKQINLISVLILYKANINEQYGTMNYTALHYACEYGLKDIAILLMNNGANVDIINSSGLTPLLVACESCHFDIACLLIENGADKTVSNSGGKTALHLACEKGNLKLIKLLLMKGDNVINDTKFINRSKSKDGFTALHISCYWGYLDVIEELLNHGANMNIATHEGSTPLHISCLHGHDNVVSYLLRRGGVNINMVDNKGNNVMHYAARSKSIGIVSLFLDRGMSIDCRNINNNSPLHLACCGPNIYPDVIRYLLERKATIDLLNDEGDTPLHVACKANKLDAAVLLIIHGGSDYKNIRNKKGLTALFYIRSVKDEFVLMLNNKEDENRQQYSLHTYGLSVVLTAVYLTFIKNAYKRKIQYFLSRNDNSYNSIKIINEWKQKREDIKVDIIKYNFNNFLPVEYKSLWYVKSKKTWLLGKVETYYSRLPSVEGCTDDEAEGEGEVHRQRKKCLSILKELQETV